MSNKLFKILVLITNVIIINKFLGWKRKIYKYLCFIMNLTNLFVI